MTPVYNLRKPAREGTFQRVWVTLGDAHLDRAAPTVDLLVNANLDAIYFCTARYHFPIEPLYLCYLVEFQTIIHTLLTSTIWLSNNGAADRTSPWLNSCILWLWVWPVPYFETVHLCGVAPRGGSTSLRQGDQLAWATVKDGSLRVRDQGALHVRGRPSCHLAWILRGWQVQTRTRSFYFQPVPSNTYRCCLVCLLERLDAALAGILVKVQVKLLPKYSLCRSRQAAADQSTFAATQVKRVVFR